LFSALVQEEEEEEEEEEEDRAMRRVFAPEKGVTEGTAQ
jgi:hypothetical protein